MSSNIFLKSLNTIKKTKQSLIYSSLLHGIFVSFYGLMPFILRKDLGATAFQISLFTMLKPAVAVFSFYWSIRLASLKSLRSNLVIAGILARIPFLFFFFFHNIWYMIFASCIYMLFSRASIPAWMEILKLNLKKSTRERMFSLSSILAYTEGVVIALFIGYFLDSYKSGWKIIFFASTLLGFLGVFIQGKIPLLENGVREKKEKGLLNPWKDGLDLLKRNREFAIFQLGFMICGFGYMLAVPALFIFYADNLNLSHTQMTVGRYIFMGLGFVFFSPVWTKLMSRLSMNKLLGFVCIGFGIFPIFILMALFHSLWLYVAFLSYGIFQAGSHLIWNLSGPFFAKEEDSSKYTAVNVLSVGIRGLIAPMLGGFLCNWINPVIIFLLSVSICFSASYIVFKKRVFCKA